MLTIEMLAEMIRDEGFVVTSIDSFKNDPSAPPHRQFSTWQAVGIDLGGDNQGAVELVEDDARLNVWFTSETIASSILAMIPLADPQCFPKMVDALRSRLC